MNKNQTVTKQNNRKDMQEEQKHKLEIPLPPPLQTTTAKRKRSKSAVKQQLGPNTTETSDNVKQIEMTLYDFENIYTLQTNHLHPEPDRGWQKDDGPECLFENYGAEREFVRLQDPKTVWTVIDADDGRLGIISGYHDFNPVGEISKPVGYLISTVPVASSQRIIVKFPPLD
jgi:hypothetical protein